LEKEWMEGREWKGGERKDGKMNPQCPM